MKVDITVRDPNPKPLLTGLPAKHLRFASIGECMVEMAPAGAPGQFKQDFAGDAFNAVWYLKALRPTWDVRFVSRVGQDQISQDMLDMMAGCGLDISYMQRTAERTVGLYLISLNNGERSFAYWRSQSAARQLADTPEAVTAAIADMDVVFFSGITMAILSLEARRSLLDVLAHARTAGKTIAFDSNLRPRLWADADEMRAAIMAAAGVADIVLPSFDEEAAQFGDRDEAATIARYQAAGVASVIVKNGPGMVQYSHLGQTGQVALMPVEHVVDTTSAGDSFNAGLIAGLGQYGAIEPAIRMASRVARQVIGQRGALVPLDMDAVLQD